VSQVGWCLGEVGRALDERGVGGTVRRAGREEEVGRTAAPVSGSSVNGQDHAG